MPFLIKKLILSRVCSCVVVKWLLRLHSALYSYIGACAIICEGGIHPKHRLTHYHDFFTSNIYPNDTVLDVGCGNGQVLAKIAVRTLVCCKGVDISAENILEAKKNLKGYPTADVVCADIWKYSEKNKYDVIVMSNVLEHLTNRPELIRHLTHSFNPKCFLIRVPMIERDWIVPYKKEMAVEWRLDATHEIEYTEAEVRQELADAGLSVASISFSWGEMYIKAVPAEV